MNIYGDVWRHLTSRNLLSELFEDFIVTQWYLHKFDQYKEFGASRLPTQYDFVCHLH
jgi:hypothetical protein